MIENNGTTVRPFLTVSNGKAAVDFYILAFGASEKKRFEMPESKISSVIEIETAEFYVADEEPHNGNLAPDGQSHTSVRIILQTKNADKLYAQAIAAGATEICPMTTEEDWRIGKLKDPFGHVWEIGYTL
ncbi:MAG: VOC family protein [Bacteroidota bacterium]